MFMAEAFGVAQLLTNIDIGEQFLFPLFQVAMHTLFREATEDTARLITGVN